MHDIGPPQIAVWLRVEKIARKIFERGGFFELRTPVLEEEALFTQSIGNTTEIVEKEMYAFPDRKGKRLALRPEGTAAIVRAYIEQYATPGGAFQRFYYLGPMFRYGAPKGALPAPSNRGRSPPASFYRCRAIHLDEIFRCELQGIELNSILSVAKVPPRLRPC